MSLSPYLLFLSALLTPSSCFLPSSLLLSLITWKCNQPEARGQFSFFLFLIFPPAKPIPSLQRNLSPLPFILSPDIRNPSVSLTHQHTFLILIHVVSTFFFTLTSIAPLSNFFQSSSNLFLDQKLFITSTSPFYFSSSLSPPHLFPPVSHSLIHLQS